MGNIPAGPQLQIGVGAALRSEWPGLQLGWGYSVGSACSLGVFPHAEPSSHHFSFPGLGHDSAWPIPLW